MHGGPSAADELHKKRYLNDYPKMADAQENRDADHEQYPFLTWGFLHTPFMIFVRSYGELSDQRFLELFGLEDYRIALPPLARDGAHIVFANDAEWTHIADDFSYTLWQNPQTAAALAELRTKYDLFQISIGDIDESFAFTYYQAGELRRKFVFEHDVFKGTKAVTLDRGSKLLGEPEALDQLKSAAERMLPTITQALGIVRITAPLQNRFYSQPSG